MDYDTILIPVYDWEVSIINWFDRSDTSELNDIPYEEWEAKWYLEEIFN